MLRPTSAIVALSLLLGGCANPLNVHHTISYTDAGNRAAMAGDWQLAERNYERALINANLGFGPDSNKSMAMYNLGQAKGHLCKFEEAEKLLTDALQLEEKVTGPVSGITTMRLFELGRLHLDRGQYERSVPYFARAIPTVAKVGVERSDPIAFAGVYDDYASALRRVGRNADADAATKEAARLRSSNPGLSARFVPTRYNQPCPAK